LAHDQAQLRGALQVMTRDLRLAGYTGLALGMDRQNVADLTNQLFPVRAWPGPGIPGTPTTTFRTDPQYGQSEGIEVWGNFTRQTAQVSGIYTVGATVITVKNKQVLIGNHIKRILMGNENAVAYHEITALVDGATDDAQVTINPPLAIDLRDGDVVAPVEVRMYFVTDVPRTEGAITEQVGALVQRKYMVNPANTPVNYGDVCYVDEVLADRISYLNLRYSLAEISPGGVPTGRLDTSPDEAGSETNEPSNPCRIRSINVRLVGQTPFPYTGETGAGGKPARSGTAFATLDYAQDVNPRNVGIDNQVCTFNSTLGGASHACDLGTSKYGL
jgi:hypothetical protein